MNNLETATAADAVITSVEVRGGKVTGQGQNAAQEALLKMAAAMQSITEANCRTVEVMADFIELFKSFNGNSVTGLTGNNDAKITRTSGTTGQVDSDKTNSEVTKTNSSNEAAVDNADKAESKSRSTKSTSGAAEKSDNSDKSATGKDVTGTAVGSDKSRNNNAGTTETVKSESTTDDQSVEKIEDGFDNEDVADDNNDAGNNYTADDIQNLTRIKIKDGSIKRTDVKEKISELGSERLSDLDQEGMNTLYAWLLEQEA